MIGENETEGLGVSAISCWEVGKLVEKGRLELPCATIDWLHQALNYPGVSLLPLTPEIAAESTVLATAVAKYAKTASKLADWMSGKKYLTIETH